MTFFFYSLIFLCFSPIVVYSFLYILPVRKKKTLPFDFESFSGVSIIVPCYNEEQYIGQKIEEILSMCSSLPDNKYEIILISDGSTDDTNVIIDRYQTNPGFKILKLKKRSGKANAINCAVELSSFEFLILTDVRQRIIKGDFQTLLAHLNDSHIGAVSCILKHKNKSRLRNFINQIKHIESKTGGTIGVYGALYAMRKADYSKIPASTILDDLLISIKIINQGKSIIVDPEVVIEDIDTTNFYNQKRLTRLISGLFQLLNVHYKAIAQLPIQSVFFLYSQKYLKFLLPVFIVLIPFSAYFSNHLTTHFLILMMPIYFLTLIVSVIYVKFIYTVLISFLIVLFSRNRRQSVLWDK